MNKPLVELKDIHTTFKARPRLLGKRRPPVRAVDGVSLVIREGEILGLVGESGCGKSTLARTLLGLQRETSGEILVDGRPVGNLEPRAARRARGDIQYVHQDPGAALDPWWRIGASLHETLKIAGVTSASDRAERIEQMLDAVGLDATYARRFPHEISGGQQRRVGLARVLGLHPRIVILDEPTSGLDLSVQATVLRLFRDLRSRFGLTYLFISHDLSVVRRMCERIAIMYLGRIVEIGDAGDIFNNPRHPYTQALLASAPRLKPGQLDEIKVLEGDPPNPASKPSGCAFHTRCTHARPQCAQNDPALREVGTRHEAACLRVGEF
ncbi:MAG: oligopeptide ABC transporter ATP-binding protein [Rhizobiaceae bacterium]|nr:oligopeptide ABC transporter ATP-binding protein [Rhizobiaceae bacterium]